MSIINRANRGHIAYTIRHKKAFLEVEKELTSGNTISGYLHDCDKLFMYLFLSTSLTNKIHRKLSKHHINSIRVNTHKSRIQTIIDWECSKKTKPQAQLSAREFLYKFRKEYIGELEPILNELEL